MHQNRSAYALITLFLVTLLCTGCSSNLPVSVDTPSTPTEASSGTNGDSPPAEPTAETVQTEPANTPTIEPLAPLPSEPQLVTFTNSSGAELNGYYYPAAINPAPLVVLMHWTNGDMSDWYEIALWLQNRGQNNPFTNPSIPGSDEAIPWLDPAWFPALSEGKSYGVFIFSFSESLPFPHDPTIQIDTSDWLDDAQSALLKALELEGVDPTRIVTIGSLQGADGAADGCLYLNQQQPGACKGTLSLSPGSYLMQDYPETVGVLGELTPPAAVWCLGMEYEIVICDVAAEKENPAFKEYSYAGNQNQGNMLLINSLDPLPMQLILDFLADTLK